MATVVEPEVKSLRFSRDRESQALVEALFERVSSVSSLPAAAMRILEVTDNPRSEARDLLHAVEGDPAIAARILRIVNSSFYSLRKPVADLKTAITLLGFSEIRNLALTAYLSSFFRAGGGHGTYSRAGLWGHSTGVGTAARVIARSSGRARPGEAYLAGLLHDLGLILIDQCLHGPFCKVLERLNPETPTRAVELAVLGFDHTELGLHVARRWRFPDGVTDAIRYHHEPELYGGPCDAVVYIVAMANFLCTLHGVASLGVRNVPEPPDEVVCALDFRADDVRSLGEQLEETLAQASVIADV